MSITNSKDYPLKGSKTYGDESKSPGFKASPRSGEYEQVTNNKDYPGKGHKSFSGHRYSNQVSGGFKASPAKAEQPVGPTNTKDYSKKGLNYNEFPSESTGPDIMRKPKAL